MRAVKEAETNPLAGRTSRWLCVRVRAAFGQGPITAAVIAALGGSAIMLAPAYAQDSAAAIAARIEGVFNVVPGNVLDLAVPLSRRALARRIEQKDAVLLPYAGVSAGETMPNQPADDPAVRRAAIEASSLSGEEEGSADATDSDEEIARLPRPRPDAAAGKSDDEAAAGVANIEPVPSRDLVASAAGRIAADEPAVAEPEKRENADIAAATVTPAELVARADCLPIAKVTDKDGDFERNAQVLSSPGLCIAQEKFKERRRSWTIHTIASPRPGPLWAVMHDDENVAFDNAVQALKAYGGTLVAVETGGKRNQDGIDPNRNFSDDEISCKKLGKSASPRFTAVFKKLIDPGQPIIAVHNNHDGPVPTGGLGHVSMKTVPKSMRKSPSEDPDGPLAGDRALLLLAAWDPVGAAIENSMDGYSANGINVVLEPVEPGEGDCSLSNYAVLSGHQHYANVTVDHDEGEKQMKIIDLIVANAPTMAASR